MSLESGPLIAVLGANGFIGSKIVKRLSGSGRSVIALSRNPEKLYKHPLVFPAFFDFEDLQNCDLDWLRKVRCIINCAGHLHDSTRMEVCNAKGPIELFKIASSAGVVQWIQVSSVGVYAHKAHGVVSDDDVCSPRDMYEFTKFMFDSAVTNIGAISNLNYTIFRPTIIYGPGMKSRFLYKYISALQKLRVFYIGRADGVVNTIFVDDVVNAIVIAVLNKKLFNKIFILSDCVSQLCFVRAVDGIKGRSGRRVRIPFRLVNLAYKCSRIFFMVPNLDREMAVLSRSVVFSSKRFRDATGWVPRVSIERGLRSTVLADE